MQSSGEVNPPGNVTPLVGAAHLQTALIATVQLRKVIGLQDHVSEFGEADAGIVTLNALLDRFLLDHGINREVLANITQEGQYI